MGLIKTYGRRGDPRGLDNGARKIATTHGKLRLRCSGKNIESPILAESTAEARFIRLADIDPSVHSIRGQPFRVNLVKETLLPDEASYKEERSQDPALSSSRFYTPDIEIELMEGNCIQSIVIEIKDSRFPGDERYKEKLKRVQEVLAKHGHRFCVIEMEKSHQTIYETAPLLFAARHRFDLLPEKSVLELLSERCSTERIPFSILADEFGIPTSHLPVLIAAGVLEVDIFNTPLRRSTPVKAAFGSLEHLSTVRRLVK